MGFRKFARAEITHPSTSIRSWADSARPKKTRMASNGNLIERASEIFGTSFNPDDYLLTHCFPAGHLVLMGDGTEKPIEKVEVGDEVITHLGNVRKVTRLLRKEVDEDLVRIQASSLPEITVTKGHPFWMVSEEDSWCNVYPSYQGQVKCTFGGKKICESRSCSTNGASPDWKDAGDIKVGDRTYTPSLHETRLTFDLNPNRMRLLGYYVAEGRVDKDSSGRDHSIRFSIHTEEVRTLGAEISDLMRREFGVSSHSKIVDPSNPNCTTMAFHSHEHAPWFLKHAGIGSRTKRLSRAVMYAPAHWQRQLLGSWINGDGCYDGLRESGNNGIRLVTTSDDLSSQAVVLLDRVGVHSTRRQNFSPGREYGGRWISDSWAWHIEVSASCAPKLQDVVKWEITPLQRKKISTKGRYRYVASTLSRVEGVEEVPYSGTVYNLSVEEDESYVVNRVAVHNCTIVASVDVEQPYREVNRKTGRLTVDGRKINRQFSDYRIKPGCDKFINNNHDAWSREALLKSYKSFIGAYNFVEHVQIPEQSKGRIIDAVARDIGDSVYVDILVATDRKHTELVRDIESGEMGTLSMGCFLPGTQVTMADGTRLPIEEVQPGDLVLTHKGQILPVKNKQILRGEWSMKKVHVRGTTEPISCTDNHPFYVYRPAELCGCGCGESLDLRDNPSAERRLKGRFKAGHDKRVLNPNGTYDLSEFRDRQARMEDIKGLTLEKVRADQLQEGDWAVFPRVEVDAISVPEGKARLLGHFLAEGSFLKRKGVRTEVQFCFAAEERDTYVAEVVELLKQEFPDANDPWVQDREDRNTSTVHVTGAGVADWFFEHGGEYSHKKKLSPDVLNWNRESLSALVGAWINGDGYLSQNGVTAGVTTSYDLVCQMQTIMTARLGLPVWIDARTGSESLQVSQVVNGPDQYRCPETGKLPSYEICVGKLHSSAFSSVCDKVSPSARQTDRVRVQDDYVLYPITKIESFRHEGAVHDMEVEEDHTYIVNGVSVSNCTVDFTVCTKCGNVAHDDKDMCDHIRHLKGSKFYDEAGQVHRVAELCGHSSHDPDGGVQFIEGSWVRTPAFRGAVMRNILTSELPPEMRKKAEEILSSAPPEWTDDDQIRFAAEVSGASKWVPDYFKDRYAFDFDDEGGDEAPKEEGPDGLEKDIDDTARYIRERAVKKVRDEMNRQEKEDDLGPEESSISPNDTLNKEAKTASEIKKIAFQAGIASIRDASLSERAALSRLAALNAALDIPVPKYLYRVASVVGASGGYPTLNAFMSKAASVLGRTPNNTEAVTLLRIAKILDTVNPTRT